MKKKKAKVKSIRPLTESEAIKIATSNGLQYEVLQSIKAGCSPAEALREWDLI